jgi:outer membrane protein insertion porin family
VVGEGVMPNVGGYGTSLSGRLKVNYLGASTLMLGLPAEQQQELSGIEGFDFRGNVGLSQPRLYALLPAKVGARIDLVGERVHRIAYSFVRFANVIGADWAAMSWLNFSLQGELEHDRVLPTASVQELLPRLDRLDVERLRFPAGNFTLVSARPSIAIDFRDDFARPTQGLLFTGTAEWTHDLGANVVSGGLSSYIPIHTLKLSGTLTGYVPLVDRVVLALSARGGRLLHLEEGSQSISPKRFFLGGAASMRGFGEDGVVPQERRTLLREDLKNCQRLIFDRGCSPDVGVLQSGREIPSEGGEAFTLLKSELRFPVLGAFDMGLFFEAGNLWLNPENVNLRQLRYVAGTGVRYATPVGPIAFDLGVNLAPDLQINEPRATLHFSIGLF